MATETVAGTSGIAPDEALARLCNAECMLDLAIRAHDSTIVDNEGWKVSEALNGVRRLLDGCYVSLASALNEADQGTGQ